jgi:DNA repair exonuclease SbcCD ATPase subunit
MQGTVSGAPDSVASDVPPPRAVAAEEPWLEELARLEALLVERATRCRALASEVERRGALCRDLSRRLEALAGTGMQGGAGQPAAGSADLTRSNAERDRAVDRALEAEAGRALLGFERDEALGRLAQLQASAETAGPVAAPGVELDFARVDGARRGLTAALAEAQEARDVLDARLLLAQQDLEDTRHQLGGARRELAELREQHEGEGLHWNSGRARQAELELQAETLAGERAGLQARSAEAERAFTLLAARHQTARERLKSARGELAELQSDAAELKLSNVALSAQLDDAEGRIRQERQRMQDLAAEVAERDHLIARIETDLSLARVEIDGLRRGVESLDAQREASRAAVETARSSAERVRETSRHQHVVAEERVDEARAALHDARDTLTELRGVLGTLLLGSADAFDGPVVGTRADQETLPGVAIDPQAFNEADADLTREATELSESRSRMASLLEALETERGRLHAVEATLRTLRPLVRDPEIVRRLDELLEVLSS